MYNKEKKGFTLVELLAVIVILGILALITTPLVLNTIESTRLGAAKTGATNYVTILEDELVKQQVLHPEEEIGSGKYEVLKDGKYKVGEEVKTLQVKGELPSEGTICVDDNGNVDKYSVVIGSYVVSNITGEQEIEVGTKALNITCDISKETVKMSIKGNANLCEKEKVVVIEYPNIDRVEKQYSFDKETWYAYEGEISVRENTTIYARVYDGESAGVTSSIIISKADNEQVSKTSPSVKLSNTKPTSVIEANIRQTDNCSLDTNTIEYGISDKEEGPYKYGKNNVFEGLKNNTIYYIKTRANDIARNGVVESASSKITTGDFGVITLESNIAEWSTSKKIKVTGETSGSTLEYRVRKYNFDTKSYEVSNWGSYKGEITLDSMATIEYPTTVYARFNDGVNTSREATLTITKIDTTAPTLTLGKINTTTRSITVPYEASDTESEIKNTICVYGASTSYGQTGTISNNRCVINNIKAGTTYYYKIVTTNNAGLTVEKTGNTKTNSFNAITITPNTTSWQASKTVTISGTTAGAKLEYRIRKYNFTTNSYEVSNWTDYSSALTLNSMATSEYPTIVYARFNDGINTSNEATLNVTTIDTTLPTLTLGNITKTTKSITVPYGASDNESGIKSIACEYGTSETYGTKGVISGNTCVINNVKANTTYYYKIVATNNAGLVTTKTGNTKTEAFNGITIKANTTNWTTSKTVTISGTTAGAKLEYRIRKYNFTTNSYEVSEWASYAGDITLKDMATSEHPITVYARFNDGYNTSAEVTYSVATIDLTYPTLTVGTLVTTTRSIVIPFTAKDSESGIKATTCEYGTSESYGSRGTVEGNGCIISNIKAGTKYYYRITTTNNAGLVTTKIGNSETGTFNGITITPSTSNWTQSKTITINGSTAGAVLEYKIVSGSTIKKDWTEYSGAITINWEANTNTPTYIQARFNDGYNTSKETTYTEVKVDVTAPNLTLGNITKTTKSITVPFTASDSESGIKTTTCEYGTSTSYGAKGTISNNSCVMNNIKAGTTYYYRVVTTNNAGVTTTKTGDSVSGTFNGITITPNTTNWQASKTVTISGTTAGAKLEYRIRKYNFTTNSYEVSNWADYNSALTLNSMATVTYPTTVYARFNDGVNTSAEVTLNITTIDTTVPTLNLGTVSVTTKSITVPYEASDNESGIKTTTCEYGTSTSYGAKGTISNNSCIINNIKAGTTYYYKIVTTNNAGMQTVKTGNSVSGTFNGITITPNTANWSTSKTISVSGTTSGAKLEYRIRKYNFTTNSYEVSGWSDYANAITVNWIATSEYPTTIMARFNDGYNTSAEATLNITTNDPTAPTLTLGGVVSTTRKITVPFIATDNESGIKSTTCKYKKEEASEYTSATISGNTCVIDNLHDADETYEISITTTNNAGASTTKETVADILDIDNTTISIDGSAATCSKTKTLKISAASIPSGANLQYRIGDNGTWTNISNGGTITVTSNTTVYARLYDGINQSSEESFTITTIDTTAPTTIAPSATSTTKSITVTNKQTDNCGLNTGTLQYGISTSVNGTYTWQSSNVFSNLSSGTTYYVKTRVNDIAGNGLTESAATTAITQSLGTCSISVTDDGKWTISKTATITKTGNGTLQYRIVSGTTEKVGWTNYSSATTINWAANATTPTDIYCRVTDGKNTYTGTTKRITTIDTTAPTAASFTYSTTTNSITVKASGTDSESGISKYWFSKDSGKTWTAAQTSNTYTFSGLSSGTYPIMVSVGNGTYGNGSTTGYKNSAATNVTLVSLGTCSVDSPSPSGWTQSKTVTASKTGNGTLQYRIVSGTTEKVGWTNYSSAVTINWEANTTTPTYVYCRVTDGTNVKAGSNTQTITTIDRTKPAKPTVSLKLGNTSGSSYTSGAWTNQDVWHIVKSSDSASGVSYYQYSHDGKTGWSNDISTLGWGASYTNGKNQLSYRINWGGQWNFYVRAVDTAGNISDNSDVFTVRIDNSAPNVPTSTVRQNNSSGTVISDVTTDKWHNTVMWWGSFSATDNGSSGVNRYEFSTNCTGSVSGTLSTNGYTYGSGTNYKFCIRAVDNTGNASSWSGAYYFKVDTVAPTTTAPSATSTTNSITVANKQTDALSGIASLQYGISTNNSSYTWQNSNVFSNLSSGTTYYVKTRAKDNAGNGYTESAVTTIRTQNPISVSISKISNGNCYNGWCDSTTVYFSSTGTVKYYYVKSTVSGGSATYGFADATCGSGNSPGTCTSTRTDELTANVWYRFTSNPNGIYIYGVTKTTTSNLYVVASDGETSASTTATISKLDSTRPDVLVSDINPDTNSIRLQTYITQDYSGVGSVTCNYSTTNGKYNLSATSVSANGCTMTGLASNTTYYYKICAYNKVSSASNCVTGNAKTASAYTIIYNSLSDFKYYGPSSSTSAFYFEPSYSNRAHDSGWQLADSGLSRGFSLVYPDDSTSGWGYKYTDYFKFTIPDKGASIYYMDVDYINKLRYVSFDLDCGEDSISADPGDDDTYTFQFTSSGTKTCSLYYQAYADDANGGVSGFRSFKLYY